MSRKDVIEKALGSVYSRDGKTKGTMVEACAIDIDSTWEMMQETAEFWAEKGSPSRDIHYQIHMKIWNWFPGGGTAEIAADRVMEALDADSEN